ncbi:MAG: Hsp20/alpha crystallin family protein [Arenicellales bacterium]|jgi:HSP20 family molecular chaperone IbpA
MTNGEHKVATRSTESQTGVRDSESQADFAMAPDVDIFEDGEGIYVRADMPGVSKDRLDIQVNKDALTIEGEAHIDMPEGMEALYADVRSTRYRRSFVLSTELDTEKIDATLKDGVLTVHIPKRAEAKPRRIEVTAG